MNFIIIYKIVICISTTCTCVLVVFFTLTVLMLVLMLEVQKVCTLVLLILVFKIILTIQTIHLSEQPPDQRGSYKLYIKAIIF